MTKSMAIANIDNLLPQLPEKRLQEILDIVGYFLEKEKKHKAFVERVLKAEQENDSVICNSVEEAMQAIFNAPDDDDEA
ncbi:MAG: hypothetical protein HZA01_04250 [Nitrospinae bacterium]|nr:hypothetical protein [Nitrospinota bacterium]